MFIGTVARDGEFGLKAYIQKTQARLMRQPLPKEGERVIILTENEAEAKYSFLLKKPQ